MWQLYKLKRFTVFSVVCFLGVYPAFSYAQAHQSKQPNIIFILTDDQGYGDVGAFFQQQRAKEGKPFERSPYLDQLAASGAMLTQQYSAAPVCAPSRASLMLGVSQGHANVRDNQFDRAIDSNYTMASTLKTLGYSTVAIGKWGLQGSKPWDKDGDDWNARPTNRGFDRFFGYMRHVDGHEHYPKEAIYFRKKHPVEVWDQDKNITPELDKCYTPDLWTAFAKKWITDHENGHEKDKPFFMYLAFETPHAVLELPTQAYPKGQGLKGGIQWLGTAGHMINTASGTLDSYIHPDYATATYDDDQNPSTKEVPWPETYKRYAMSNRRIDYCVGDLMALLKDLKIDENTLVVFTSDNGPSVEDYLPREYTRIKPTFFASYGPFDGIKRDNWEGGIRMPVIASWPGHIPAGKVVTRPGISYDWPATFIQAAGAVAPERMDGVSLLPELTEPRGLHRKDRQQQGIIYNEYYFHGKTPEFKEFAPNHRGRERSQMQFMRLKDYVGVRYDIKAATDDFEIYNVLTDPEERHNLALTPDMPVKLSAESGPEAQMKTVADLQAYFKAKVLQVRRPEKWAKRPYDSALVPAVSNIDASKTEPGLKWRFYKGDYNWIPQTGELKITARGRIKGHSFMLSDLLKSRRINSAGILALEGYINAPRDGVYTFYLKANSNTFLRLHEMQLIDADFGYQPGMEKSATVFLKAGLHPIHLFYKVKSGGTEKAAETKENADGRVDPFDEKPLDLEWAGPGFARQVVAGTDFYSQKR